MAYVMSVGHYETNSHKNALQSFHFEIEQPHLYLENNKLCYKIAELQKKQLNLWGKKLHLTVANLETNIRKSQCKDLGRDNIHVEPHCNTTCTIVK